MDAAEIRAAIAASPVLQGLVPDTVALATALSDGRVKQVPTEIGNGLILSTIGLEAGNALLDTLYSVPTFKYVVPLLEQGRLDVSTALVRSAIGALMPNDPELAAALLALADRPDPVSEFAVRCALFNDDGSLNNA